MSTATSNIREVWEQGKPAEVNFWRGVLSGSDAAPHFKTFHANFLNRIKPDRQFRPSLIGLIKTAALEKAKILDIAAGPVTQLGWEYGGKLLDITAIDALADEYDALLDEYGFNPPIRTVRKEAERPNDAFPMSTFDLVSMKNALDHCYDPVKVIAGALFVLKPSAVFVIESHINEAQHEKYIGLHQWNVDTEKGDLLIWRPGERIGVQEYFGRDVEVQVNADRKTQYLTAFIRKMADK